MSNNSIKSCGDVFRDLGFPSEEAEKLNIKTQLMLEIRRYIEKHSLTQKQAASLMGVNRPRISDVKRGQIHKFTIDALVDMLARAGRRVTVKIGDAA